MKPKTKTPNNFDSISLKLASPETILSWSYGAVTKAETINYRTQKPERGGLFCEKIFGPETDYNCSCGKYKGPQYSGITCDKCGVEVTRSAVRRDRMGHIELCTPITHIWYLRKTPSRVAQLLGLPPQATQKVTYFSAYLITSVNEARKKEFAKNLKKEIDEKMKSAEQQQTRDKLQSLYRERIKNLEMVQEGSIIDETHQYALSKQFEGLFVAEKGPDALFNILKNMDLKKKLRAVEKELETASAIQSEKLKKQAALIRSFIKTGTRPEWMFLTILPVIPPGIRPLVPLDGGRFASSDLNDLYRIVIIRNNRLKNFIETRSPKIFIDTQKRLVQESVDALIDGTIKYNTTTSSNRGQSRQLKSLSETLSGGKKGFFRQNLLGKRVDYSGRSVIVVGPHLHLNECGLPKEMALELFRPFVISELMKRELAYNIRGASRMIDDRVESVWEALESVTTDRYVLLNRQPTLHRQGIQAFKPVLIEGKAIELHPLVCEPYNADFDGDTMSVHLPLSEEAQLEAKKILVSTNNLKNPGTGQVNISPARQDITLGCYWATTMVPKKGIDVDRPKHFFSSINEAISAYDAGKIGFRDPVTVLPSNRERYVKFKNKRFITTVGRIQFNTKLPSVIPFINEQLTESKLKKIIDTIVATQDRETISNAFDDIKRFGFNQATLSGTTMAWSDLIEPPEKTDLIKKGSSKVAEIKKQYEDGLLSVNDRKRKTIDQWQATKGEISEIVSDGLPKDSPLGNMIFSGARGDMTVLTKIVGMLGIVDSATGEPLEQAITSSIKNGMNAIEYFNFSFGARKGLSDTALKTADAGYLTRRLFEVAQEVNVIEKNCGTTRGFKLHRRTTVGVGVSFAKRIKGRYLSEDIKVGSVDAKKNQYIDDELSIAIEKEESIEEIKIRSPISCRLANGVCVKCYGDDKTTGEPIDLGEAVGTIAAQSIGEPGTQLTMRTFHAGGVAGIGGDITDGLPRITEIFDRRMPKALAIVAKIDGVVESIEGIAAGQRRITLAVQNKKAGIKEREYTVARNRYITVSKGDSVSKGDFLTDGSADLQELLEHAKKEKTQEYIYDQVSRVYELQGVHIASVHLEIIIRQMFSRHEITDPGDSQYIEGDIVAIDELTLTNMELENAGKKPADSVSKINGLTNVSTSRRNFLSSASFQQTVAVLIRSILDGDVDRLDGLKENVITGRLVPIGTNFKSSKKNKMLEEVRRKVAEELERDESRAPTT